MDYPDANVLQHGFSHRNHAPPEQRKMELGWHRPASIIRQQLSAGRLALQGLFASRFVPIQVPPWNRIDERVVALLPGLGFSGVSTLGPRSAGQPVPGLRQLNVHVDIMNWREGRCFAGEEACIEQVVTHLRAKREGYADPAEPTGIMSHHLVHDSGCWVFLEELFTLLSAVPGATIVGADWVVARPAA